jgi:hypothetical protein
VSVKPEMPSPDPLAGPVVFQMSQAEWDQAVEEALDRAGLTWEQLADMARAGHFTSLQARKLWLAIGAPQP